MSFKNNRKESLPCYVSVRNARPLSTFKVGVSTFKVGDGAHYGFNGDRTPVTVVKISDSGRQVFVSYDDVKVIDNMGGYVEGNRECEFTTVIVPEEQCVVFKLDKNGVFRNRNKLALNPGRQYARNPCIWAVSWSRHQVTGSAYHSQQRRKHHMFTIERKNGSGYFRVPSGELSKAALRLPKPGEFKMAEDAYQELKRLAVACSETHSYRITGGNGKRVVYVISSGTVATWKTRTVPAVQSYFTHSFN
jgi:hypothetical protein